MGWKLVNPTDAVTGEVLEDDGTLNTLTVFDVILVINGEEA
jgi:hypothetical protein